MRIDLSPPAILLPLFHQDGRAYGNFFRTTTVPPKTSFDFVSVFEGDRGGLTSTPEPGGASIPAGSGELRQVIVNADIPTLYANHRDALDYLEKRGVRIRAATFEMLVSDVKRSMAERRESFFQTPILNTVATLWRAATKKVPEIGPIQTPGPTPTV